MNPLKTLLTITLTTAAVSASQMALHADVASILSPTEGRVWYVSPTGANNNDGTKEAPLKQVDAAVKKAAEGDTIAVAAGNYQGTFGVGHIVLDKPLKLYGSFSEDFSARCIQTHSSLFQPDNASGGKARKPMLAITRSIDGVIIDGFVFDSGMRNSYSSDEGKPEGVETGMLLLPPKKNAGDTPTVVEPLIKVPSAAKGGEMIIRNNAFLNAPNFGIQAGLKSGKITVTNNVFVANRMAAIEIYGTGPGREPSGDAVITNNTIIFTWSRLKDFQDMGYGVRIMTKAVYNISDNLIGGNVLGGVDNTRFNPSENIKMDNNTFFVNRQSDLFYSPGSNMQLRLRVAEFGDLDFASAQGNKEEIPAKLPVNQAYLSGYLAASYTEETDLDRESPANQWRSILGMPLQGTMTSSATMFGNRYPVKEALQLFGAAPGVGAQAMK